MKNRIRHLAFYASFISLCLCLCACHENEAYTKIYVKNNSDKTVYYGISRHYPDTSLQKIGQFPGENGNISHKLDPKEKSYLLAAEFAYNPTLQFFIFDADVIEREDKDSIIAHYKVLRRYQFTEIDLEKANWTIAYP